MTNYKKALEIIKNLVDYYNFSEEKIKQSLISEFQYTPNEAYLAMKKYKEKQNG